MVTYSILKNLDFHISIVRNIFLLGFYVFQAISSNLMACAALTLCQTINLVKKDFIEMLKFKFF